jgi:hypothetical protein
VFEVTEHNIENKIIFTTDFHNNFIRKCWKVNISIRSNFL